MDGQYGDSTRSVKAVGSARRSRAAGGVSSGTCIGLPLSADESEALDTYGRGIQSHLAATGIGARRTSRARPRR